MTGTSVIPSLPGTPWSLGRTKIRQKPVVKTMIATDFSGWTTSAAVNPNLADTSDSVFGTAAKWTTNGATTPALLRKLAMTAANLTNKKIMLWFKLDGSSHTGVANLQLYAGDTSFANFKTWDLWQSGVAEDLQYIQAGNWWTITLDWGSSQTTTGAPSRTAVTDWQIRVQDTGANAITVHLGGIALIPDPTTTYPNGVVTFTFDDGYDSHYSVARPYLDKYGYAGTAYVICDLVGTAGYMTETNLRDLETYNGWDVGAHAYTLDTHNTNYDGMSMDALDADMVESQYWLWSKGLSSFNHCALPHGQWTKATYDVAKVHFSSMRTTYENSNNESVVPADPLRLRMRQVAQNKPLASLEGYVDTAFSNNQWLIFMIHRINASPTGSDVSISDFQSLVDYVNSKGMPVRTVSQVLEGAVV